MKNAMQLKAIMKKLAKENQISAQLVLQNYMLERFLERVSLSPYRDNYIIKGGFLISSMVGLNSRATMDILYKRIYSLIIAEYGLHLAEFLLALFDNFRVGIVRHNVVFLIDEL